MVMLLVSVLNSQSNTYALLNYASIVFVMHTLRNEINYSKTLCCVFCLKAAGMPAMTWASISAVL